MYYYIFYNKSLLYITCNEKDIDYVMRCRTTTLVKKQVFTNMNDLCDYVKITYNNYLDNEYYISNIKIKDDLNILCKHIIYSNKNNSIYKLTFDDEEMEFNDYIVDIFKNKNNIKELIFHMNKGIDKNNMIFIEKLFNELYGNIELKKLYIVPVHEIIDDENKFKLLCEELIKKTHIIDLKIHTHNTRPYNGYTRTRKLIEIREEYAKYINELSKLELERREVPINSSSKSASKIF